MRLRTTRAWPSFAFVFGCAMWVSWRRVESGGRSFGSGAVQASSSGPPAHPPKPRIPLMPAGCEATCTGSACARSQRSATWTRRTRLARRRRVGGTAGLVGGCWSNRVGTELEEDLGRCSSFFLPSTTLLPILAVCSGCRGGGVQGGGAAAATRERGGGHPER